MTDFAAIDFETANFCRTSVCSVGIVIVRGGKIVDKYYSLIRPTPNYYNRRTTEIHGLTQADTACAPTFPEVWKEASRHIGSLPLVAHNKAFDENCLRSVFEIYGLPYPEYTFFCTLAASRRKLGRRLPNHQLHTVAEYCGFPLDHHHHALADAEACAAIAMQLL